MSASKRHIRILLLLAAGLLAGCVREDPPTPETQEEIRLDASVWQMMQGAPSRRVSTYDSNTDLQAGTFKTYAYVDGTTDLYIDGSTVSYSAGQWTFDDGKHYWPASGSLDFFAYMPATKPDYISSITYAVSGEPIAPHPSFVCANLPMTGAGQPNTLKEFIYALTTGQNKASQGASGVDLTFKHPFAKIILKLSSTQADIQINKITLKSIKNNGTYTHGTGWSTTGDSTNFVTEYTGTQHANDVLGSYILIPQKWEGDIEVNATWIDWGEMIEHTLNTKLSSVTWAPGTSYTYTFTITETDLWVDIEKFTEQW